MDATVEAPVPIAPPASSGIVRRGAATAPAGEYLTFFLGRECHAMAILGVQEIRGYVAPTRIAGAPAHVKGVINLRGAILPIIDLRILCGHRDPAYDAHTAIIIVDVGSRYVGVVVDSVADVLKVAAADIRPAPECTTLMAATHVRGIAALGQGDQARLLILIDPARMLSDADLADPL